MPVLATVLDSSVLTAAFLKPDGINREVLRRAGRDYRLVLSEAILEETERVLMTYERIRSRYPCSDEDVRAFLGALRGVSRPVITAWPEVCVVREDPDDDMVLGAALAGGADVIVSKDYHLQALGSYQGIRIISTQDFVRMLERGESG